MITGRDVIFIEKLDVIVPYGFHYGENMVDFWLYFIEYSRIYFDNYLDVFYLIFRILC